MTSPARARCRQRPRRQRGLYALEFAFVFLMLFGLLYASLCFGLMFAFRAGLQNAAEDGARAALRYQVDMPSRTGRATAVALERTVGWLPVRPTVATQVCAVETGLCATPACGLEWTQRCQIVVTVTATGMHRVLPALNFAMPDTLTGRATLLLDGRSL